ncbi:E-beta-farnesene synthase, partial [Tanacetum coccineum]
MDEGFIATAYPKVQENLKLTVEEQVILEEPASFTGTFTKDSILRKRIGELEQHMADLVQANLALEERMDKHGFGLYKSENLDIPHQVSKAVDEIVTDAIDWAIQAPLQDRFSDLPEADMKEILHPPQVHIGSSGAFIEYTAWTTTDTRLKPSVSSIPEDLHMDADSAPDEQVHSSDDEDIGNDHIPKVNLKQDWWKPLPEEDRPATPEPAWSIPSSDLPVPMNNWASALASTYAPPPENSLLAQTDDMAIFMDWFCKKQGITKLTQKDLEGPAFEIVKVFHPNVIHLQYQMEECHKLLTDKVDDAIIRYNVSKPLPLGGQPGQVTIQADFFFNKDLEYLRYGSKGGRPALSISKMKAACYPDVGLEQMVPDQMWIEEECKYDIAAMYGHLNHLPPKDKQILSTAVNLWIKNLVIRQRHDFTVIDSPRAVTFRDKYGVQMIMRFNEIHKFSDGTLQQIDEALDYQVKEFKVKRMNPGLNIRFWTRKDVGRSKEFMFAIQKRLKTREDLRNLGIAVIGENRERRLQTSTANRMITSSRQSGSIFCWDDKVRYSFPRSRQSRRDVPRDNPLVSVDVLRFLALGWHLEEIHVTWAHLEKKWTRLRTYTKSLEEFPTDFWGADDEEISEGAIPRVIVLGYKGLPMQPAHDPDYVPEPIYPEYIPLEDDHEFLAEEQPLPPVDSPTAESPSYVTESDPEEDPEEYEDDEIEDGPVDYPMDGEDDGDDDDDDSSGDDADGEDEEEEEHLAPADSAIVVPVDEPVFPPEGTEPVIPPPSTDITIGVRITVRPQASISLPPEAEDERLLVMTTPSPSPPISLSPPSAGERLARCSELTKDDRESQLYNEFERFLQIKGETIHVYYVRFTKLINDIRNIKMTMSIMQLNSKFVNNMLPEWSRFITEVKLNRGLKESSFDQLYAYLKQHEVHANKNRMMMERFIQPTNDPLALVSNASIQQYPTQSSMSQSTNQPSPADNFQLDSGSSSTENLIESLTNSLSLLTQSYKSNLPQTNNQLRTSSNARNKATVQDGAGNAGGQNRVGNVNPGQAKPIKCYNCNGLGHIARECPRPKRPQDSNYFKDKMLLMQAQENGAVLDEEQLLFLAGEQVTNFDDDVDDPPEQDLALNVDHVFEADQLDAFDSDVDEAPTTHTMFMANLTSEDPIFNEAGTSYDSDIPFEVQDHDNYHDSVY